MSNLCEAQEEFPAGLEAVDGLHSLMDLVVKALRNKYSGENLRFKASATRL